MAIKKYRRVLANFTFLMPTIYGDEPNSVFVFRNPFRFLSHKRRQISVYVAGGLVALGWWVFIDAVVKAATAHEDGGVRMGFEDWFSGILTTLGMIVVNLIDKSHLQGETFSYSGSNLAWKARLFLFLGFALIAGGFAGSLCVLILKYIIHLNGEQPYVSYGAAGVGQCGLIMLSATVLWVAQSTQEEYQYNVRL